jgi:DnaJ-domain-containing protein 1
VVEESPVITEDYVRERLAQAVHALATGTEPLRRRLFLAALATSTLQPRDFVDEESRAAFGAFREMLTRHEARADEGRVGATLARMSDDEARSVARRLLELDAHYRPLSFFAGKSIRDRADAAPQRGF